MSDLNIINNNGVKKSLSSDELEGVSDLSELFEIDSHLYEKALAYGTNVSLKSTYKQFIRLKSISPRNGLGSGFDDSHYGELLPLELGGIRYDYYHGTFVNSKNVLIPKDMTYLTVPFREYGPVETVAASGFGFEPYIWNSQSVALSKSEINLVLSNGSPQLPSNYILGSPTSWEILAILVNQYKYSFSTSTVFHITEDVDFSISITNGRTLNDVLPIGYITPYRNWGNPAVHKIPFQQYVEVGETARFDGSIDFRGHSISNLEVFEDVASLENYNYTSLVSNYQIDSRKALRYAGLIPKSEVGLDDVYLSFGRNYVTVGLFGYFGGNYITGGTNESSNISSSSTKTYGNQTLIHSKIMKESLPLKEYETYENFNVEKSNSNRYVDNPNGMGVVTHHNKETNEGWINMGLNLNVIQGLLVGISKGGEISNFNVNSDVAFVNEMKTSTIRGISATSTVFGGDTTILSKGGPVTDTLVTAGDAVGHQSFYYYRNYGLDSDGYKRGEIRTGLAGNSYILSGNYQSNDGLGTYRNQPILTKGLYYLDNGLYNVTLNNSDNYYNVTTYSNSDAELSGVPKTTGDKLFGNLELPGGGSLGIVGLSTGGQININNINITGGLISTFTEPSYSSFLVNSKLLTLSSALFVGYIHGNYPHQFTNLEINDVDLEISIDLLNISGFTGVKLNAGTLFGFSEYTPKLIDNIKLTDVNLDVILIETSSYLSYHPSYRILSDLNRDISYENTHLLAGILFGGTIKPTDGTISNIDLIDCDAFLNWHERVFKIDKVNYRNSLSGIALIADLVLLDNGIIENINVDKDSSIASLYSNYYNPSEYIPLTNKRTLMDTNPSGVFGILFNYLENNGTVTNVINHAPIDVTIYESVLSGTQYSNFNLVLTGSSLTSSLFGCFNSDQNLKDVVNYGDIRIIIENEDDAHTTLAFPTHVTGDSIGYYNDVRNPNTIWTWGQYINLKNPNLKTADPTSYGWNGRKDWDFRENPLGTQSNNIVLAGIATQSRYDIDIDYDGVYNYGDISLMAINTTLKGNYFNIQVKAYNGPLSLDTLGSIGGILSAYHIRGNITNHFVKMNNVANYGDISILTPLLGELYVGGIIGYKQSTKSYSMTNIANYGNFSNDQGIRKLSYDVNNIPRKGYSGFDNYEKSSYVGYTYGEGFRYEGIGHIFGNFNIATNDNTEHTVNPGYTSLFANIVNFGDYTVSGVPLRYNYSTVDKYFGAMFGFSTIDPRVSNIEYMNIVNYGNYEIKIFPYIKDFITGDVMTFNLLSGGGAVLPSRILGGNGSIIDLSIYGLSTQNSMNINASVNFRPEGNTDMVTELGYNPWMNGTNTQRDPASGYTSALGNNLSQIEGLRDHLIRGGRTSSTTNVNYLTERAYFEYKTGNPGNGLMDNVTKRFFVVDSNNDGTFTHQDYLALTETNNIFYESLSRISQGNTFWGNVQNHSRMYPVNDIPNNQISSNLADNYNNLVDNVKSTDYLEEILNLYLDPDVDPGQWSIDDNKEGLSNSVLDRNDIEGIALALFGKMLIPTQGNNTLAYSPAELNNFSSKLLDKTSDGQFPYYMVLQMIGSPFWETHYNPGVITYGIPNLTLDLKKLENWSTSTTYMSHPTKPERNLISPSEIYFGDGVKDRPISARFKTDEEVSVSDILESTFTYQDSRLTRENIRLVTNKYLDDSKSTHKFENNTPGEDGANNYLNSRISLSKDKITYKRLGELDPSILSVGNYYVRYEVPSNVNYASFTVDSETPIVKITRHGNVDDINSITEATNSPKFTDRLAFYGKGLKEQWMESNYSWDYDNIINGTRAFNNAIIIPETSERSYLELSEIRIRTVESSIDGDIFGSWINVPLVTNYDHDSNISTPEVMGISYIDNLRAGNYEVRFSFGEVESNYDPITWESIDGSGWSIDMAVARFSIGKEDFYLDWGVIGQQDDSGLSVITETDVSNLTFKNLDYVIGALPGVDDLGNQLNNFDANQFDFVYKSGDLIGGTDQFADLEYKYVGSYNIELAIYLDGVDVTSDFNIIGKTGNTSNPFGNRLSYNIVKRDIEVIWDEEDRIKEETHEEISIYPVFSEVTKQQLSLLRSGTSFDDYLTLIGNNGTEPGKYSATISVRDKDNIDITNNLNILNFTIISEFDLAKPLFEWEIVPVGLVIFTDIEGNSIPYGTSLLESNFGYDNPSGEFTFSRWEYSRKGAYNYLPIAGSPVLIPGDYEIRLAYGPNYKTYSINNIDIKVTLRVLNEIEVPTIIDLGFFDQVDVKNLSDLIKVSKYFNSFGSISIYEDQELPINKYVGYDSTHETPGTGIKARFASAIPGLIADKEIYLNFEILDGFPDIVIKEESSLKIITEYDNQYLTNLARTSMTVDELLSEFVNPEGKGINIIRDGLILAPGTYLSSGDTLVIGANSYIVVIAGDVNDDGLISLGDAETVFNYLIGDVHLANYQLLASDIDNNNEINQLDLVWSLVVISGLDSLDKTTLKTDSVGVIPKRREME